MGETCAYLDGPSDLSPRESEQQSLGLVERICLGPASSSFHPSGPCAALGVSPDVRAVSVRVTVAPQWVRTPYFVIEMDRPPVAELPPEVSEEAAEDKPPEPAEQAE